MAVDYFAGFEEDKEEAQGSPRALGQESPIVGGGNEKQQPGQGTSSGSYTNLQSYLDANKSLGFGGEVAGRAMEDVNKGFSAQQKAESDFNSRVSPLKADESLYSQVKSDPVSVYNDPEKSKQFKTLRDAQYTGPMRLEDLADSYSEARTATTNASQLGKDIETDPGKKAYLSQTYSSPTYSQGQQKLDAFLVQTDPNSKGAFKAVQDRGKEVETSFGDLLNRLNQKGTEAKTLTDEARTKARDAIGLDATGNLKSDSPISQVQEAVRQKQYAGQRERTAKHMELAEALRRKDITPEQASRYGLSEGTRLYGLDPSNSRYLQAPLADPTFQQAASRDDQLKLAALSDLAGVENTFLGDGPVGGYDPTPKYNTDLLLADLASRKADYEGRENEVLGALAPFVRARDRGEPIHPTARYWEEQAAQREQEREELRKLFGYYDQLK